MLRRLKRLWNLSKENKPAETIEEKNAELEGALGKFKHTFKVEAVFDAATNTFCELSTLHIEGNPQRLGQLLLETGKREPVVAKIMDIGSGKVAATTRTDLEGMSTSASTGHDDAPVEPSMSDDDLKDMIRKQNKDLFDD